MSNCNYDYSFKILLIGESGVGKTCLLLRFTDDTFTQNHQTTVGVDFKQKILLVDKKIIKIQVWDTAGQERFRTLTKGYYKMANGIILTYDVTNRDSFESIKNWLKQVEQLAEKNVCRVIVGNKCDVEDKRSVTFDEGQNFAKEYNIPFFETSAKNNIRVSETFAFLTQKIIESSERLDSCESGKISLQKNEGKLNIPGKTSCSC
jgi:small GTP-binding protein